VPRVRILTDSAATIDPATAQKLSVTVLPLTVSLEDKRYEDKTELSHEELLLRMASSHTHPQVVGPSVAQFTRAYSRLTRYTDEIISLHCSAALSPVHSNASAAAADFMGRCDINVLDSETVSLGLALLVAEAARLAQESVPLCDIMREIRGMMRRIYIVLTTDTLDYLEYSGLISPAQAILGTMLDIKPFLAIEDGRIIPMEKVRGRERAIDKLAEFAGEFAAIQQIAILQSTPYPTAETKMLRDRLSALAPGREFPILLYGPVLASHIGPDGMGLVVYEAAE
jgi:DegV family protein with EDD domain